MFGRELRLPIDLCFRVDWAYGQQLTHEQYAQQLRDPL